MKKLIACAALGTLLLVGCNENNSVTSPADKPATANPGQRVVSEIKVGDGSLTFIANGNYFAVVEKRTTKSVPILGKEMDGLTWSEIHQRLAPGKPVPSELAGNKVPFSARIGEGPVVMEEGQGSYSGSGRGDPQPLAKAMDPNDAWFAANYCQFSGWNAYKACMLNQTGWTWAYAYASVKLSKVFINPWLGQQVHIRGTVGSYVVFDYDMLAGGQALYNFYMESSRDWFFGTLNQERHRYDLTAAPGHAWHWSYRSHTW